MSPSRTAAIGPPRGGFRRHVAGHEAARRAREAAVGDAARPTRRGPRPRCAPVTASISRMPGPPRRPLVADDDDVARLDLAGRAPPRTPPSSLSKTRAGPRWCARSWPATLTTQPSGARLPCRMTRPPVVLSGCASGRDDLLARRLDRRRGFLADGPAGHGHARRRAAARPRRAACATSGMPPAVCRSVAT